MNYYTSKYDSSTQHQTFSKISSEIEWKFRKYLVKTLEAKKLDFDLVAVSIEICAGKKKLAVFQKQVQERFLILSLEDRDATD